jgi:hypothetical protein
MGMYSHYAKIEVLEKSCLVGSKDHLYEQPMGQPQMKQLKRLIRWVHLENLHCRLHPDQ